MKKIDKNISIKKIGVCDIYEVGNWAISYPWIRLGYNDKNYQPKYSDITYYIKENNSIIGYYLAYNIVNMNESDIIPLYSKKLVLYDFAIDDRAYAKYGLLLINYMLDYARKNGYKAIEIKKYDEYSFFMNFIKRHYKVEEFNNSIYIILNPVIKYKERHLTLYKDDNVSLEDIYFLYDLGFNVLKNSIKLKLLGEEISINRHTGSVKLPSSVKISNDNIILNKDTRNIIYLIKEMYINNNIKNLVVDYSISNPNSFLVYDNDLLYINKDINELLNNIELALQLSKLSKAFCPYIIGYDMNERGFSRGFVRMSWDDLIDRFSFNADSKSSSILAKNEERIKTKEFNLKLEEIKQFDFRFGNSFCGIKKLSIYFNDEVGISSNGQLENDIIPNKDDIIKELKWFNFSNWNEKYSGNNSKMENSWSIRLKLKEETFEFVGYDDYPNVWPVVEWFVHKYSKFIINYE